MRAQPTIAIVGAGYGGLTALGRILQLLPHARLLLVEPGELHVERARLHRALRGEPVAWRLEECLPPGVRWIRERAVEVGAHFVRTQNERIPADHVIVAAGARPRKAPTPAISAWDLAGIRRIRRQLRDETRVVVLGGGLTGIEVACAIATRFRGKNQVELRDRGSLLLPNLPASVRTAVEAALEKLHVEVRLGLDEPPPPNVVAVAATGADPCAIPGEGALRVGDADPFNRLRCAQIARLQGQRAAAEVARLHGVNVQLPQVEMLGQVIDLGAAGATGWVTAGGMQLPLPAPAAALGLEAVAVRHRAFLRTLPFFSGRAENDAGPGLARSIFERLASPATGPAP
ncbi:FAD-dependent oxidoreductase [Vulgatibacter sp.]|uniref:FAD-dependent oxidoreductase n=1 Tax=Vulgatibacter sp. TaxID=1971226 RepID=UPI003563F59C